jgi:rhodanese-related sulfurtransferase
MNKRAWVISRSMAVGTQAEGDTVMVSFSSTHKDYTDSLHESWDGTNSVRFVCDDVLGNGAAPDTDIHTGWTPDDPTAFTPEMATELVDFINLHQNKNIFVHCDAGISRSAAVGRFIDTFFDHDVDYRVIRTDRFANIHIFNLLRRDYMTRCESE